MNAGSIQSRRPVGNRETRPDPSIEHPHEARTSAGSTTRQERTSRSVGLLRPRGSGFAPWRSTSGRFVLLSLAICLACVVPILGYVYHEIDRLLLAEFQRPLEYRQGNLLKHFDKGGVAELQTSVASRASRAYQDQTAILLVDRRGQEARRKSRILARTPGRAARMGPGDASP